MEGSGWWTPKNTDNTHMKTYSAHATVMPCPTRHAISARPCVAVLVLPLLRQLHQWACEARAARSNAGGGGRGGTQAPAAAPPPTTSGGPALHDRVLALLRWCRTVAPRHHRAQPRHPPPLPRASPLRNGLACTLALVLVLVPGPARAACLPEGWPAHLLPRGSRRTQPQPGDAAAERVDLGGAGQRGGAALPAAGRVGGHAAQASSSPEGKGGGAWAPAPASGRTGRTVTGSGTGIAWPSWLMAHVRDLWLDGYAHVEHCELAPGACLLNCCQSASERRQRCCRHA